MSLLDKINNASMDYPHEAVPMTQRRGAFALFAVWFVIMLNLVFIFFGINISQAMPLKEALLACFIGQSIAALLSPLRRFMAREQGYIQGFILPHIFGIWPAKIITLLIGLMGIFWFGFQLELSRRALTALAGFDVSMQNIAVAIGGIIMISSGIIGFKAIDWLSRIATPLLLIMLAMPTVNFLISGGDLATLFEADDTAVRSMEFGQALSILLGGFAIPLIITADIMRYAKTPKQSFWITLTSQVFGAVLIVMLAIFLGKISSETEFINIMAAAGFGVMGLLMIMLATWTTNDTNIYISSLSFSTLLPKIKKWIIALICGVSGIIIGMLGVLEHFMQALNLFGVFFGPIGAVFQAGLIFNGARDYLTPSQLSVKYISVLCIGLGILASFATNAHEMFGWELFTFTTVPMLDGYIVSFIAYTGLSLFNKYRT